MRVPCRGASAAARWLSALVFLARATAAAATEFSALPEADPVCIRADPAFLADDLLEGREAGSRGQALADRYVAARFEALGLADAPTRPRWRAGGFYGTLCGRPPEAP